MEKLKPLIILTGPTAVGKTELSIKLAKQIGGEIVSADSMQVYKLMDIGTAKIKENEMGGIPHHMIDILNPEDEFNVFIFQSLAQKCLHKIYNSGHIPIITGGTGFYIQALLYDIDFSVEKDMPDVRSLLEKEAREEGAVRLHERLKKIDPLSASLIHQNNIKRVIRALEFYELTGRPISAHNMEEREKEAAYNFCYFVLNDERDLLYKKIDSRVDNMFQSGLLDEVRVLRQKGYQREMVSMQGLGYKELFAYLDGEMSLEEAICLIKRDTRHFAKRQLTWFKREKEVIWINKNEFQYKEPEILDYMNKLIENIL